MVNHGYGRDGSMSDLQARDTAGSPGGRVATVLHSEMSLRRFWKLAFRGLPGRCGFRRRDRRPRAANRPGRRRSMTGGRLQMRGGRSIGENFSCSWTFLWRRIRFVIVFAASAAGKGGRASARALCRSTPRGVAQSGSAFGSGPKGRRFKSSRPDRQLFRSV